MALAIYSPNRFLLRFIKPSIFSKEEESQLRTEALRDYRLIHGGVDTVVEADFFEDRLFISSEYQDQVLLRDFPKTKIKPTSFGLKNWFSIWPRPWNFFMPIDFCTVFFARIRIGSPEWRQS